MTATPARLKRHRHLSPAMRDALRRACCQPLRRVHDDRPGRPAWPAHPSTLAALTHRHGLLAHSERQSRQGRRVEEWSITELGVEALDAPGVVRRAGVLQLRAGIGSTVPMQLGTWVDVRMPEPEAVRLAA